MSDCKCRMTEEEKAIMAESARDAIESDQAEPFCNCIPNGEQISKDLRRLLADLAESADDTHWGVLMGRCQALVAAFPDVRPENADRDLWPLSETAIIEQADAIAFNVERFSCNPGQRVFRAFKRHREEAKERRRDD